MFFKNRKSAGKQLVKELIKYQKAKDCIVIGLPRGGVVTAFEISSGLDLPLDIVCPRKIRAPFNEEFALGAVTETDIGYLDYRLIKELKVSEEYLKNEIEIRQKESQYRLKNFRKNKAPLNLKNKTVILVDDGLATGATMLAAISDVRKKQAAKVIVAVPVSPPDSLALITTKADEVICLYSTPLFYAVGQFYEDFDQTEDSEVMEILESAWGKG